MRLIGIGEVLMRQHGGSSSPIQVRDAAAAMRRLHTAVDAFEERVAEKLGINRTDLRCLDIILQDGPITAGALSKASHLTSGGVTTVIDRLEDAGWACRLRDTHDRRRVLIEATAAARRAAQDLYQPVTEAGQRLLGRFSPEERSAIHAYLEGSREINDVFTRRLNDRVKARQHG